METLKKETNRFKELLEKTKNEPIPVRLIRYFFGGMAFIVVISFSYIILRELFMYVFGAIFNNLM